MLPIQRKISPFNHYKGNQIKYIRIHDVGTVSSAKNNADYFAGGNRGASAHLFVDDISIWQSVEFENSSWDVGDGYNVYTGRWMTDITNYNGISIEGCLKAPLTMTDATFDNMVDLTKYLMAKYNIPASRVVRHNDASGKTCPGAWSANNWARWKAFKAAISSGGTATTPPTTGGNNMILEQSAGNNMGATNLNTSGFLRTGEYLDVISFDHDPKYATDTLIPYLRKHLAPRLLDREVRWYKYANHYKITVGWLNEAWAKKMCESIKKTLAGQFVNYDKSQVKAIKEPNSWRVEAIVPLNKKALDVSVAYIKQDVSPLLLTKRIYSYDQSGAKKKAVVISNLTVKEAKGVLDSLRKWFPAVVFDSKLQY